MAKREVLNTWEVINAKFDSVDKSLAMREADLQFVLVCGLTKWKEDGDCRGMLALGNKIKTMQAKGIRKNSLVRWFEVTCGFKYDTKTKEFSHGGNKKYNGDPMSAGKWWDALAEETYTPLDEVKALETLVKRLKKRIADGVKEEDNVHIQVIGDLEKVLEEAKALRKTLSVA